MMSLLNRWNFSMIENGTAGKRKAFLLYTILFVVIFGIVFSPFFFYHKTFIWKDDGFDQWYSMLVKFCRVWRNFASGKGFELWCWDTGLGGDLIGNYALIFFDPFNYIALLFSDRYMDLAYTLIIAAKMYAAGAGMYAFIRYEGMTALQGIVGGLGYCFCAWSYYGLRHDFFMLQLVLFPLVMLGVHQVRDHKKPVLLVLSVAVALAASLYFSYIIALFTVLYLLVMYFTDQRKRSLPDFLCYIGAYIGYVLLSVLLVLPILLPALYTLLQAGKESGVDIELLLTVRQWFRIPASLMGTAEVNGNYSFLGTNPLIFALIPVVFLNRKRFRKQAIMLVIVLLAALLPPVQSVINGLSYPTGRWCFVFVFFVTYGAVSVMEKTALCVPKARRTVLVWLLAMGGITLLSDCVLGQISQGQLIVTMIFLSLSLLIWALWYTGQAGEGLVVSSWTGIIGIALCAFVFFSPRISGTLSDFMTYGDCYEVYSGSSWKYVSQIGDKDFYRTDGGQHVDGSNRNISHTHTPSNLNMFWNTPSLFGYLSTLDAGILDLNRELGNNCGYFRRVCTFSNDNRARLDYLLGVRYFLGDNKKRKWKLSQYAGPGFKTAVVADGNELLRSSRGTSIGYLFDRALPEAELEKLTPLQREQALMQGVCLGDEQLSAHEDIPRMTAEEIRTDEREVGYEIIEPRLSGNKLTVSGDNRKIVLHSDERVEDAELFVVIKGLVKTPFTREELWEQKLRERDEASALDAKKDRLFAASFNAANADYHPYENLSVTIHRNNMTKRIVNAAGEPQGIRSVRDYTVNLGRVKTSPGNITLNFGTDGNYSWESITLVKVPLQSFRERAKILSAGRLRVRKNALNFISGELESETPGILYLSIPYNPGWRVWVDGKASEIFRADKAFSGVWLDRGRHSVELKFRPLGYPYVFLGTVLGIILLGAVCVVNTRKEKR